MAELALYDCCIDCVSSWRPGFSDVVSRLRVSIFPNRLVVTRFEDADEDATEALSAFEGDRETPWRDVVLAAMDGDIVVTFNEEWPDGDTLAGPTDLKFEPSANLPLKLISLAWLGSQWSEVAKVFLRLPDNVLRKVDETNDILAIAIEASAEVEEIWFSDYERKIGPEEILARMIEGVCSVGKCSDITEQILAEIGA